MSKRRQAPAPDPAATETSSAGLTPDELATELADVELRAQDFICRVDFNETVRKEAADGTRLDIDTTVAKYRAIDDKPGAIADEALARLRGAGRERGAREYAELGVEI